ncbi:pentatricopeptide repeat-containing protein At4g21065-like [Magnolia sinica]|uniref:pentatricopeptide repeat-containing protein At4g21065-like n=1 Tax=Magnolia sinica TaxID=86752 RepID=UPI00265A412D|nr:pentatricopeptide repeat-containing protein At4g21065-like [Magnolia sinica]
MDLMSPNKAHLSSLLPFKFKNLQDLPPNLKPKQNPSPPPNAHPTTLDHTKQIHAHMIKTHLNPSRPITPDDPIQPQPTHFNFIITSYINHDKPNWAISVYAHLRAANIFIDNFTLPSVLKACGRRSEIGQGKEIHGYALKIGLDWDIFIHNALVQMYSECDDIESARWVFDKMPERDIVSWSTMIGIYNRSRFFYEALGLIKEMRSLEIRPTEVAMINMVSLFAGIAVLEMGRAMHAYVIKNCSSEVIGVSVNTALIDMYVKCGSIRPARRIFDQMVRKSVVSWTAMIAGHIRCGNLDEVLKLFCEMQEENVIPNEITMLSLVLECGSRGALELGKWLHVYVIKNGFVMSIVLATALVDMYGKCGAVASARAVFDRMDGRDVMTWTAMISGYTKAQFLDQAFDLFIQMKNAKIKPNEVTMVNLLSLCVEAGALDLGKWIHACIDKQGIESDVVLATALIDMYAKCGDIDVAYGIFVTAPHRDVCMWNAMMGGLAMHGHGKEALELFSQMEIARIKPNDITFIGILHACSHAGLVADGQRIFNRMVHDFGLAPKVEHYGCMVDLLGRAGRLNEAYKLICSMPIRPNIIVWGALLAACKLHRNLSLGELAAERLLKLEPYNCGYNVLISNIYAAANRWADVADMRRAMKDVGLKKAPGFSSIEVNGSVHEFVMGDESHPKTNEIHEMIAEMSRKLREAGYVADTSAVLLNLEYEEKETALNYHSEKLAMAYGLISTAPNTPIWIIKNLRVCDDCHAATKLLSKIYGRVIVVRDRNRFHRFSEGSCSCRDYW